MKRHLSVFMLCIRSKIYQLLLLFFGTAVLNIVGSLLLRPFSTYGTLTRSGSIFFGLAVLAEACCCICVLGFGKKNGTEITLQRLRISRSAVYLWDVLTCSLAFGLLWAVEIVTVYTAGLLSMGDAAGPQNLLMGFYRSSLLHALIPMAETGLWWRNVLYCCCAGIFCASANITRSTNKQAAAALPASMVVILTQFPRGVGEELYIFPFIAAVLAVVDFGIAFAAARNGNTEEGENNAS